MIHWIASPDDPRLDPYRHVGDSHWLQQQDLFVAEGRLVVERLIASAGFDIVSILVNRAAHDAMLERLADAEADVYVCHTELLAATTGFNFHRGCLALAVRPKPQPAERLFGAQRLLALEGVGNPDNIGGLFRTAAALGADGIVLNRTCGDPLYRKAIRTSMGAALQLPFVRLDIWREGLERFRARGFRILALTPRADAVPIAELARDSTREAALMMVVGAEGPGVGDDTLAIADASIRIPIDTAVDSLNVVVAAGIALDRLRGSSVQFPVRP